jgi:4-hydroxybenzoate polyprenyltransferase
VVPLVRAAHVQPALAVTAFVTVVAVRAGRGAGAVWVCLAILAGQLFVGWSNDWLDRDRDVAAGRRDKPVAAGQVPARVVGVAAVVAFVACVPLSLASGPLAGLVHVGAVVSAGLYNAWLKRTAFSPLPYAVSFGSLPFVVAFGLPGRPGPAAWAPLATALLGVGAHFVNTLPDQAADRRLGVLGLPQRVGRTPSLVAGAALLVAAGVVVAALPPGPPRAASLALLGLQVVAVAGVVAAAAARHERGAWTLTLAAAGLAVAQVVVNAGALT